MTSNLGSDLIMKMTEERVDTATINHQIEEILMHHFKPEFLNRIDESIIFQTLSQENMIGIVEVQLKRLASRLADKKMTLRFSQNAKKYLVSVGYNPLFGARPLKRAIQRHVEDQLARELLEGKFVEGDVILVDADANGIFVKQVSTEPPVIEAEIVD
jgi:ATP-dependent Clp protease ATP-binding subunit ClpB